MSSEPITGREIWAAIAAPLPPEAVEWRQDGKAMQRDGQHVARFVAYVNAQFVRERLDSVVPGEWDLSLTPLPPAGDADGVAELAFKASLTVLGVRRECVGTGKDYKSAASDAFKRAAVRFGIAHELYAYDANWVPVDGDGRFARPLRDPGEVYRERHTRGGGRTAGTVEVVRDMGRTIASHGAADSRVGQALAASDARRAATATPIAAPATGADPRCPKCEGAMWDNRATKRNPKAPDYKCRDKACDGVVWPPKQPAGNGKAPVVAGGMDDEGRDFLDAHADDSDVAF